MLEGHFVADSMTYLLDMHKLRPEFILGSDRNANFSSYFLVFSSVENLDKQTSGWLQVMESFSVIWCSFLLVNVHLLVRNVGEYLLLIITIFVLFEGTSSCFNSFGSQLKLLLVNCSTVCVVTYGRWTKKEKSDVCSFDYYCYWLSPSKVRRICERHHIQKFQVDIFSILNCKFDCGAENDSFSKLDSFPLNLSSLKFSHKFLWISIKRCIEVWARKHFLLFHNRGAK